MSERFKLVKIDDYVFQIHDVDDDLYLVAEQICNLLNEQQSTIQSLKEENKKLNGELYNCEKFRYQVFQRLNELTFENR